MPPSAQPSRGLVVADWEGVCEGVLVGVRGSVRVGVQLGVSLQLGDRVGVVAAEPEPVGVTVLVELAVLTALPDRLPAAVSSEPLGEAMGGSGDGGDPDGVLLACSRRPGARAAASAAAWPATTSSRFAASRCADCCRGGGGGGGEICKRERKRMTYCTSGDTPLPCQPPRT